MTRLYSSVTASSRLWLVCDSSIVLVTTDFKSQNKLLNQLKFRMVHTNDLKRFNFHKRQLDLREHVVVVFFYI